MINSDIQTLEPGALVTLLELDATGIGGETLRFHAYTQSNAIWWQGQEFRAWPVEVEGIGRSGEASQPTPTLSVGNIGPDAEGVPRAGVISSLCRHLDDLVGAKLIVHQTLGQYLDAANFPEGNPSADPGEHLVPEVWLIEQKTSETAEVVSFMLSSPLDFDGVQLPRGKIIAGTCQWLWIGRYRGPYCGYTGSAYFDAQDNPVSNAALDRCGGRPGSCRKRFAAEQGVSEVAAIINFGGFPSADRVRA